MLSFRIVAAIAAAQIFVVTVLWPDAHPLLGPLLGAAAGAVLFAVGRALIAQAAAEEQPAEPRGADAMLLLASGSAVAVIAALFFIIRGPGAGTGTPWVAVVVLVLGLVLLGYSSVRLNRLVRGRGASGPAGS